MLRQIVRHPLTRRFAIALCLSQLGAGTLAASTMKSFGPVTLPSFADLQKLIPVRPNKTRPRVTPPPTSPRFSARPTKEEIGRARVFREPLVPVGLRPSDAENADLARIIAKYHADGRAEAIGPFLLHLTRFPGTPWRASIQLQAGNIFVRTGFLSRALVAWEAAWLAAKDAETPAERAIAHSAVAEWLDLTVRLGQVATAEAIVAQLEGRNIGGSAGARIRTAREGLWVLKNAHHAAAASAAVALHEILRLGQPEGFKVPDVVASYHPTSAGTSLSGLQDLARSAGLTWQMAKRVGKGTAFVVPSIVHLRSGHYSALVKQEGSRYLLRDAILGGELWVSEEALEDEASGYFLVPETPLKGGWHAVTAEEAASVVGHCAPGAPGNEPCEGECETGGNGGDPPGPGDDQQPEGGNPPPGGEDGSDDSDEAGPCPTGLAVYSFHPVKASLLVRDIPLGYRPPRGPAVMFRLSYDHRDELQPQVPTFGNLGPQWTFSWLSYVTEVPLICPPMGACQPAHVTVYLRGGGEEKFASPDVNGVFAMHWRSKATLVRVAGTPVRYERRLRNGSVEVFGQADGAPSGQQRFFLTERIDRLGQKLQFTYDGQLRLVAVTDSIGQVTTLAYAHPTDPLKLTQVIDPFGRSATLTYTDGGQLASITDIIGLVSRFSYGDGDFISALQTPYGTTTFRRETSSGYPRVVEATDPLGGTERLEFHFLQDGAAAAVPSGEVPSGFADYNEHLNYYNTLYWNKRAWRLSPGDASKALQIHWLYTSALPPSPYGTSVPVPHSYQQPLERRVWFAYPGQTNLRQTGTWRQPSRSARVLTDGTTQASAWTYNSRGNLLSATDPLGRTTAFTYAINDIDFLTARQTTSGANDLLVTLSSYTAQHQPQSLTDAAGQMTTYTYSTAGQLLTVTNAKSETTTLAYDTHGYLTTVTGPVSGTVTTVTYDGYGRPRTLTTPDGYAVTVDYDLFDRRTKVTYPDGTFEAWTYDRLDLSTSRDRLGWVTRSYYDALRRPIATRDPLGRTVTQEWCGCGALEALVDPNGNRTRWERDAQNRVISEVRANGSSVTYTYDTTTSRLLQRTDAKGQHTTYAYNLDEQLQQIAYPNAEIATPTVALTYEAVYGRLATMVDGIGTTSYAYRPAGQLGAGAVESVDGPLVDDTITYGYDPLGRVVSRTLGAATTTWTFDGLGRLTALGDPIGSFTYTYDGTSDRVATVTYPNSQTSTYSYFGNTGDRRLEEIHHKNPTGGTLSRFAYTYDAVGNIGTWIQQYESTTRAYDFSYDAADQLTGAIYRTTDPTPTVLKRYGYAYDPAGNRTTERIDDAPRASTYDAMNRLVSQAGGGLLEFAGTVSEPASVTVQGRAAAVTSGNAFVGQASVGSGLNTVSVSAIDPSGNTTTAAFEVDVNSAAGTLTYDANGNLIGDGNRTFDWDAENRLSAVSTGSHRSEFEYDGSSRRSRIVEKEGLTTVHDAALLWDGMRIVEERLTTGGTNRFLSAGEQHGSSARYVTRDHVGSVREVTDNDGNVVIRNDYDPYGRLTRLFGTASSRFGYTGHLHHDRSGLFLAVYRAYDPQLATWISSDPIGVAGGINLYQYVLSNPARYTDPFGLNPVAGVWPGIAVGGTVGGPLGAVVGGLVGAAIGGLAGVGLIRLIDGRVRQEDSSGGVSEIPGRPPFVGAPGTTVRGDKQTRVYGTDGYPVTDVDTGHDHGQGDPHVHPWTRPPGGGPPTAKDRGHGRPWRDGDPPKPRNCGG
jgi:RHS repeat-associated protein